MKNTVLKIYLICESAAINPSFQKQEILKFCKIIISDFVSISQLQKILK